MERVFERIFERVAELDVHKAQVTAAIRVPNGEGGRLQDVAEFKTTVQGLLALRDWLMAHTVTHVAMEATGVHRKAPWAILEDEFECLLVNARHVKHLPGRKTDVSDAAWLAQLLEAGLLRASFVAPKPIRALRNLTRYRKTQIAERQRVRPTGCTRSSRTPGSSSTASPRTSSASPAARCSTRSCRAPPTRPCWPSWPRAGCAAKIPALQEALEGRFDSLHALIVASIVAHLDFLDEAIDRLSDAIEEQLAPFAPAVELLCTLAGVQRRTAQVIVAEIGPDMAVFPTPKHLASWAGQCPGNDRSAGKLRSGRTRKGSRWLGIALTEAALATRTKNTYRAARYQRLRPRRGHKRALGAVRHSMLITIWHMLTTGKLYRDPGGDYFQRRDPDRQIQRLVAQLQRLGQHVTLQAAAA